MAVLIETNLGDLVIDLKVSTSWPGSGLPESVCGDGAWGAWAFGRFWTLFHSTLVIVDVVDVVGGWAD